MALYKQPEITQYQIVTLNFEDLFPPEHPTYQLLKLIQSLDLSKFDEGYKNGTSKGGRAALPVDRMLAIMLYSLLYGNLSMRSLSRDLTQRADLMFLSGGVEIDHSTFTIFRNRHAAAILKLFKQTVFLGVRSGFINLDTVCIDGTKIKAYANDDDIGDKEKLEKMYDYAEKSCEKRYIEWQNASENESKEKEIKHRKAERRKKRIEEGLSFLKDHEDRKRVHIYEKDADYQKSNGKFLIGYNVQQAVDYNSRMIVSQEVQTKQSDAIFTVPMVKGIENLKEELPFTKKPESKYLLDAGYASEENLQKLDGLDIYMPDGNFAREVGLGGKVRPEERVKEKAKPYQDTEKPIPDDFKIEFRYDAFHDKFTCLMNEKLKFKKTKIINNINYNYYRKSGCSSCRYTVHCADYSGTRKDIMISADRLTEGLIYSPQQRSKKVRRTRFKTEQMREKLKVPANRLIYGRRMMIEGVFATIKAVRKGREFLRRGINRVSVEYAERSIAHNLQRILTLRKLQEI